MHFHHGLYEVHLPVTDVGRAIDFYETKLGFELGFGERSGSSALLLYGDGDRRPSATRSGAGANERADRARLDAGGRRFFQGP